MARMRLSSVTTSTKFHKPRGLSRAIEAGGRITKRTSRSMRSLMAVQSRRSLMVGKSPPPRGRGRSRVLTVPVRSETSPPWGFEVSDLDPARGQKRSETGLLTVSDLGLDQMPDVGLGGVVYHQPAI